MFIARCVPVLKGDVSVTRLIMLHWTGGYLGPGGVRGILPYPSTLVGCPSPLLSPPLLSSPLLSSPLLSSPLLSSPLLSLLLPPPRLVVAVVAAVASLVVVEVELAASLAAAVVVVVALPSLLLQFMISR